MLVYLEKTYDVREIANRLRLHSVELHLIHHSKATKVLAGISFRHAAGMLNREIIFLGSTDTTRQSLKWTMLISAKGEVATGTRHSSSFEAFMPHLTFLFYD